MNKMVYFVLLVSDSDDIVLLQEMRSKKLGYEVYNQWSVTENGFREWYKLIGRSVRMKKCDCNVEEKMKQLKMESRV